MFEAWHALPMPRLMHAALKQILHRSLPMNCHTKVYGCVDRTRKAWCWWCINFKLHEQCQVAHRVGWQVVWVACKSGAVLTWRWDIAHHKVISTNLCNNSTQLAFSRRTKGAIQWPGRQSTTICMLFFAAGMDCWREIHADCW
jgi:hypothetical protein